MKFDKIEDKSKKSMFIKFEVGVPVSGFLRGEPKMYRTHWANNRFNNCIGEDCTFCANRDKPKFRFKMNFLTQESGVWTPKILDQGFPVYKEFSKAQENGYDLERMPVKITKKAVNGKTEYETVVLFNKTMTPEMETTFKGIPLLPLESQSPNKDLFKNTPTAVAAIREEDIPF